MDSYPITQTPSGQLLIGPKFILHQDKEIKHTTTVIKSYLQRGGDQGGTYGLAPTETWSQHHGVSSVKTCQVKEKGDEEKKVFAHDL